MKKNSGNAFFAAVCLCFLSVAAVSCGNGGEDCLPAERLCSVTMEHVNPDNVFYLLSKAYDVDFPVFNEDGIGRLSLVVEHDDGRENYVWYEGSEADPEKFYACGALELNDDGTLCLFVSRNPSASYSLVGRTEEPLRLKIKDSQGKVIVQRQNTFVYGKEQDPDGESFVLDLMSEPSEEMQEMLREKCAAVKRLLEL